MVRSKGSIPDTINELSTVIKHFPFDTQAWIELASIYISASKLEVLRSIFISLNRLLITVLCRKQRIVTKN